MSCGAPEEVDAAEGGMSEDGLLTGDFDEEDEDRFLRFPAREPGYLISPSSTSYGPSTRFEARFRSELQPGSPHGHSSMKCSGRKEA